MVRPPHHDENLWDGVNNLHLVTAGCSFAETYHERTWPVFLNRALRPKKWISKGMGSVGNGYISKAARHAVWDLLEKGVNAEDILVGISWSSMDRIEWFTEDPTPLPNQNNWMCNPANFVERGDFLGGWVIGNHHWHTNHKNAIWYDNYWSDTGSRISTMERILETQHFLEKYDIKYFMTQMNKHCAVDSEYIEQSKKGDLLWLHDQLDFTYWLPIGGGILNWCLDVSRHEFPEIDKSGYYPSHPLPEMHEEFVQEVVVPFLKLHHNI